MFRGHKMREIRRKEKAIHNQDIINTILHKAKYVTLALSKNNQPYLVTLSHGFDSQENVIYFHCAADGKKMEYIKANNRTWGQALLDFKYIQGACDHKYATVQFSGDIEIIKDFQQKKKALQFMIHQLKKNQSQVMKKQLTEQAIKNVTIGKITISNLSGKKHQDVHL